MPKKKTTYSVTLNYKYKSHFDCRRAEIKAESADEAKKTFIAELAKNDSLLNILLSIDENFETKMLNAVQCEDLTAFLKKKADDAQSLLSELKTVLVTMGNISPELLERFKDDYRSLYVYSRTSKDEVFTTTLKQCEILLNSVEGCARLNKA